MKVIRELMQQTLGIDSVDATSAELKEQLRSRVRDAAEEDAAVDQLLRTEQLV